MLKCLDKDDAMTVNIRYHVSSGLVFLLHL
jgi:hypothetical protein